MRISDWSSDVCSSDLVVQHLGQHHGPRLAARLARKGHQVLADLRHAAGEILDALQVALRLGLAVALEQQQRIVGIGADCRQRLRSEEHTSELQSLMRISYAVFCLKKKKTNNNKNR